MTNHIIITSTVPRIRYVSNGVLATYSFPFAIFKNSDLKVYFGSELQDATTYTVSGAGASEGGSITLSNVPESGVIITLMRDLPVERTSDFQEGGVLRANTLNNELDYQIACQQQIADNLNRSMVLPPYAVDSDIKLTLPMPSAGKAIVWNAQGTNLENSTVEVNALESTIRGYKESAEAAATTATIQAGEAAAQVQAAATQAQNATTQAGISTTQAGVATTQAGIATQKAQEVASALSTKANTSLNNLTADGKKKIISVVSPDYDNPISITLPASEQLYTVQYDGIMTITFSANNSWCYLRKGSATGHWIDSFRNDTSLGGQDSVHAVVHKGDVIYHKRNGNIVEQVIFPFKGA